MIRHRYVFLVATYVLLGVAFVGLVTVADRGEVVAWCALAVAVGSMARHER